MKRKWILFAITALTFAALSGCSRQTIIAPEKLALVSGQSVKAGTISYQNPMWPNWQWWQNLTSTKPKRWDVVVFRPDPQKTGLRALRVVGLPGEKLRFQENMVLVDDQPVPIPDALKSVRYEPGSFSVPLEHYFLLSDNPQQASDSRTFGPVGRSAIRSRIDSVKNGK